MSCFTPSTPLGTVASLIRRTAAALRRPFTMLESFAITRLFAPTNHVSRRDANPRCCRALLARWQDSDSHRWYWRSRDNNDHGLGSCWRRHRIDRAAQRQRQSKTQGLPGDDRTKHEAYNCDVRNPKDLRAVYKKIWDDGVKADILLNCAGVQRRSEAVDFTDEDIELVLDINIKATLVSCQEFAKPLLVDGRPGKIINIASSISFIGGKNITPYAASKGGVLQVTKAFSNEWAEKGIQCNCIHPGYFKTPLTEQYSTDPKYKEFNNYVLSRTPAKRWGEPVDLQGAVVFLASKASDYVSGSSVVVDGGWMGM